MPGISLDPAERVRRELVLVRLDRVEADGVQVVDRRAEADRLGHRRRARLELVRQLAPRRPVEPHRADHVAAGEERLHRLRAAPRGPRARRRRSGRTSCAPRSRRSRRRAPARRPSGAAPTARRRGRRSPPCACAHAASFSTGLIVPSEFETWFVATTLTFPCAAISSSVERSSSPCSSSGIIASSRAGLACDVLPRHEVRVVLELGDDDEVARAEVRHAPTSTRRG